MKELAVTSFQETLRQRDAETGHQKRLNFWETESHLGATSVQFEAVIAPAFSA
jgi:hypothetical protein